MTLLEYFDSLLDVGRPAPNAPLPSRAFVPAADLVVTDDEVTVYLDAPGLKPENLEIELTGDVLTVRGERPVPFPSSGEDEQSSGWYRLERGYGKFQRILQVPKGLDPDKVRAELVDGVLTLRIAQPEARKPRRIQIAAGGAQPAIESPGEEPGSEGDASHGRQQVGAPV